jgi:predicted RNase H-like HicB family nuclease
LGKDGGWRLENGSAIFEEQKRTMELSAIVERSEDGWYVGQLEELPEVLSQGRTLEELMDNLRDAMHQLFIANKQQVEDEHVGRTVIRERLKVA